jgi:DNA repair photolyase
MNVIYEPKGRAKEYADLACNLYRGCTHGCTYCYAPGCMRTTSAVWHEKGEVRKNVLDLFAKDVKKLSGDPRRVLFCFLSDPYQALEGKEHVTRQAIQLAQAHHVKVDILTKGDKELILADLPLMKAAGVHLGITLSFINDASRKEWEPFASSVKDRLAVLKRAHDEGVFTWVSMEPVIKPEEALAVVRAAHPYVNFWKVGKLNHNKAVESLVDWRQFRLDIEALFKELGISENRYYIKADLRKA